MSLKTDVFALLDNARRLCGECQDGRELAGHLEKLRARLDRPLRVAVVGIMKAGKSTFLNALIGADVVFTGDVETTYTVCWFRYGEKPGLTICFRDGSQEQARFEDLQKWSVRAFESVNPRIHDVKYLLISYPAEILKVMEFIDTPGLNSSYQKDAQNTLDFLALQGSKDTVEEAGMADAVIYAFTRSAGGFDQKILEAFHGEHQASPINSVGILTKADATGIWQVYDTVTPVQKAGAVCKNVMENQDMRQLLFTVLPVCAKTCQGFFMLQARDFQALEKLSKLDPEDLQDLLSDAHEFKVSEDPDYACLGALEDRSRLMDRIGQYGILQLTDMIRKGLNRQQMSREIQILCGVAGIRRLLMNHFGNRTFLIKSQFIFAHLNTLTYGIRSRDTSSPRLKEVCTEIIEQIENLQSSVQNLKELRALQLYYGGQLQFTSPEEKQDFLRITGEFGRSPEKRLGAKPQNSVAELAGLALKKANEWHAKEAYGWMMPGAYVQTAAIVARSYEQMYYHLSALLEE